MSTLRRITSSASAGTVSSCSMEVDTSRAAASGIKARVCRMTPLPSSTRTQLSPSRITPPFLTVPALTPALHTATRTSTTYLGSSASPGSHQRPFLFRQRCHISVSIGTWWSAPWQSQRPKRPNIGQPSVSGCLAPHMIWKRSRSSTGSCCMPASCFQPAGLI